jgi:sugar phosphate isomerase/epimerase
LEDLMRIGLFTDGLSHLSRREAFEWCAARGITDVEMSVGPWGTRTHLDLAALLDPDPAARQELRRDLDDFQLRLSAVNAAGNPLHPDPAARQVAQAALRGAVRLAARMGVDRVVTMAGCPGGRTGGPIGVFGLWATSNDDEGIWQWQMEAQVGPFWQEMSAWAAAQAPDLMICLELHPGVSVYGVESYRALRAYTGGNIGVNLDPSHFWWQGADPVRVIEALGPVIGWCHGKDTTVYPERVAVHGVLDHRYPPDAAVNSWHFSAIGDGHDVATWGRLVRALQAAGHDSVVSIEHEHPSGTPEECIERAVRVLTEVLAQQHSPQNVS